MKTDKITVFDLFETQRRYLVPIFQRGYVWTRSGQWGPLWEDIIEQTAMVNLHKKNPKSGLRKHFLGAVVLSHVPTSVKQVAASEIIDGQQRLLTLQVFLAALRDAIADLNEQFLTMQLGRLTANPRPTYYDNEQYKVWPTGAYQEDIKNVMGAGRPEQLALNYPQRRRYGKLVPPRPGLVDAYFFFHQKISEYLSAVGDNEDGQASYPPNEDEMKQRANGLFETVLRYIQLVEIQLDSEDDPQVIFETLNYRGIPLEPSDLIRNFIFLLATRQEKNVGDLYSQYWKDYDETDGASIKFWKEKERQGRFFRSRLDLFFFHYLTYRSGREVKMGPLYQEFKNWWESDDKREIKKELDSARRSSKVFRSVLDVDDTTRFGVFAQRLRILDTTTVYPLLLWLCPESVKGCRACRLLDHFKPLCPDVSKSWGRLRTVISSKTVKTGAKQAPYQPIGSSQSTLSPRDRSSY